MAVKTYQKTSKEKLSENFCVSEFACKGSGCCSTVLVDEQLVTYLQKIRDHFGKPVTINSGYRCATHNKRVGGATSSRHAKGQAADIAVKDVAPAEVAKYAESIGILGIGLYETAKDGYFVHIDTRTSKSFWYGQAQENRTTFGGAKSAEKVTIELKVLKKGSKGAQVKAVQRMLYSLGYNLGYTPIDGEFGGLTDTAIRAYQKKHNLPENGIVDETVWKKLLKG